MENWNYNIHVFDFIPTTKYARACIIMSYVVANPFTEIVNDYHGKEQPLALGWETLGRFNVPEIGKARTVSCLAEII
jgi:hypothetical protein